VTLYRSACVFAVQQTNALTGTPDFYAALPLQHIVINQLYEGHTGMRIVTVIKFSNPIDKTIRIPALKNPTSALFGAQSDF
jgi:hypothetical protein